MVVQKQFSGSIQSVYQRESVQVPLLILLDCPKGLLCGRVSENDVCPSVCVYVCTCVRVYVTIKNDQVLDGKSSLSKVNGSKRDPKRDQIDGLIARF